jgi:sugar (pentulose or hexulose) kinase
LSSENNNNVRIAIDLGASSGRVIVSQNISGKIELAEIHRFDNPSVELPTGLHWNIFGLYHEILTGLKKAIDLHGENIASVGIDTWGCDFGLLDQHGEIIGTPHQYRDPRTNGMAEKMHELMPEEEIFSHTGIKTNFYNTALHLFSMSQRKSVSLSQAADLLLVPDILAYWLTGIKRVEKTNASTTQLLDSETGDWSDEVIEGLGLPRGIFGEIVEPGTILGNLRAGLGGSLGRSNIPFVVAPCHDTASAVAGIPLSEEEPLWLSSGTWSIMGVERASPIRSEEALSYGFCNELGIDNTVRFLKNIGGLWIIQECKRQWDLEGEKHSFAELAELSEQAEPFFAFVDPDEASFANPGEMPERIQKYCKESGQKVPDSIGQIMRVATDSLALKYRFVYERITKLTGRGYSRLNAGGGGIQNKALCQATANALGIEVQAGPVEATSCGNLITQMLATGEIKSFDQGRQLIRDSFEFQTYQPMDRDAWDQAYADFRKILNL